MDGTPGKRRRRRGLQITPLDLIHRYLTAMRNRDWGTGYGFYADDVVLHLPGRSRFAGALRGRDAVVGYLEAAIALVHDGGVEVELIDTLASEERVALLVRERFTRDEGVVEIRRANVYRIRGEEIAEIWIFEANQYEVDALFGGAVTDP
jgi:ketosteroid isomerase-like protein